jgi:hypothetical protein
MVGKGKKGEDNEGRKGEIFMRRKCNPFFEYVFLPNLTHPQRLDLYQLFKKNGRKRKPLPEIRG